MTDFSRAQVKQDLLNKIHTLTEDTSFKDGIALAGLSKAITNLESMTPPIWAMEDITNVLITSGADSDILIKSGSNWVNANPAAYRGILGIGSIGLLSSIGTSNITNSAVTYAKIQNVSATDKILGRSTAGAGVVEEITCTAAGRALIAGANVAAQRTTLGMGSAALLDTGTSAGQIPILDGSGKIDTAVLPSLGTTETYLVADQTAMLALSAQVGDIAVRSDLSKTFILKTAGASTLGHWQEFLTPPGGVITVAGRSGDVILVKADITDLPSVAITGAYADLSGIPQDIATTASPTFAGLLLSNGAALKTGVTAGNTLLIQARDVDGASYTTFITLTANNTPTCDLSDAVTKGGQYIYRAGGTDLPITDGGTGASTAADARTNLGLGTSALLDTGTAAGNVPVLDGSGKLNTAVLPALAITDTYVAANQSAMLALSDAEVGDIAVRTDLNKTFILKTAGYSTLANWQELLTPTDSVTSVAGRTGVITLTTSDISGLAALALKATIDSASLIDNAVITYAKIQNVSATDIILGRSSSGAGTIEEITCTAAGRALIDDSDATAQRTTLGLGTIATQNSNSVTITGGTAVLTSATTTNIYGGTGTSSSLNLNATSGVGSTGSYVCINVGNNGATNAVKIDYIGQIGLGGVTPITPLHLYVSNVNVTPTFTIEQASTGDAQLQFLLTSTRAWVMGIDNSDGDKFKIALANDDFASTVVSFDTSYNAVFTGGAFIGDVTLYTGSALKTNTGSGNTLRLQAYNTGGSSYTTFATLTAGATPTMNLDTSVTINSKAIKRAGKETIYIPAAAMYPALTNGATYLQTESSTNKNNRVTLEFDSSTEQYVHFHYEMPKAYDGGTVTALFVWSHPSTATNFGVVWGIQGVARTDAEAFDVAFGTAQTVVDTGGTTDQTYRSDAISAMTIAGTPTGLKTVEFRAYRKAADGSDTLGVKARLHGIVLFYNSNVGSDD